MQRLLRFVLLAVVTLSGTDALHAQQGLRPGRLAVFYGWPTLVNGAGGDIEAAAAAFADYHLLVLGAGLEDSSHPDHDGTVALVARLADAGTQVFGYVPLGVTTAGLSAREVEARIRGWERMGVAGIFLDEAGYDYGVSRDRQNRAVGYTHRRGLRAFVNAWEPDDVFGRDRDPVYNPRGRRPRLGPDDLYLHESFQFADGAFQDPAYWRAKTERALAYRERYGTRMAAVTTPAPGAALDDYDPDAFAYAWYSALAYGLDAVGWGEDDYSALLSRLPFRSRPAVETGDAFLDDVEIAGDVLTRTTDTGRIDVDLAAHAADFVPAAAPSAARVVSAEDAAVPAGFRLGAPYPNPLADRARLTLVVDAPQPVRVQAFDVLGRAVALLHDGPLRAGDEHVFTFDAAGLPPGVYVLHVRGATFSASRSVTVAR